MSNTELWDRVCKTNPKITKGYKGKGGYQGTAICAQAQRKKATEIFGPLGNDDAWLLRNQSFEVIKLSSDPHDAVLFYHAELHYCHSAKKGVVLLDASMPFYEYIQTYKNWSMVSDIIKKIKTDALTKGLSELGFNSDVFEGLFDDNKYIQQMVREFADDAPPADKPKAEAEPKKETAKPATHFDTFCAAYKIMCEGLNIIVPEKKKEVREIVSILAVAEGEVLNRAMIGKDWETPFSKMDATSTGWLVMQEMIKGVSPEAFGAATEKLKEVIAEAEKRKLEEARAKQRK